MAFGYHNPHPVLGRAIATATATRCGPLPFQIGVPIGEISRGTGPLPFQLGVPVGEVGLPGGPGWLFVSVFEAKSIA